MKLNNAELIEEFYDSIKDEFDLTFDQVVDICFGPFIFTKKIIEKGDFESVRLKYFGNFTVYSKRIKSMLEKNKEMLEEGRLSQEQFEKYNLKLLNYIENEGKSNNK